MNLTVLNVRERLIQLDSKNGLVTTKISDDFGKFTFVEHDLTVGESCKETHSILPDDPCSAMSECSWHAQQSRLLSMPTALTHS